MASLKISDVCAVFSKGVCNVGDGCGMTLNIIPNLNKAEGVTALVGKVFEVTNQFIKRDATACSSASATANGTATEIDCTIGVSFKTS